MDDNRAREFLNSTLSDIKTIGYAARQSSQVCYAGMITTMILGTGFHIFSAVFADNAFTSRFLIAAGTFLQFVAGFAGASYLQYDKKCIELKGFENTINKVLIRIQIEEPSIEWILTEILKVERNYQPPVPTEN